MADFDLFGIAASTFSGTPTIILEAPFTSTPPAVIACNWEYDQVCSRSGGPASPEAIGIVTNPYVFTDAPSSLLSYCDSIYSSSLNEFELTAPIATGTVEPQTVLSVAAPTTEVDWVDLQWSTTVDGKATWTETTFLSTITYDGLETLAAVTPYTYATYFSFVASEPCCLTCTLYGGNVQVFYWPSATATATAKFSNSSVSTLVDSNGFTFISPSVYVAFRTLYATDLCGYVGPKNQPTTLAFKPNELSTSIPYSWNTTEYSFETPRFYEITPEFTAANWGAQTDCSDTTISFWQEINQIGFSGTVFNGVTVNGGYTSQYSNPAEISSIWSSWDSLTPGQSFPGVDMNSFRYYTVTYNPCSPLLEVPTTIYSINSLWKACAPGIYALFDPPYALTPGSGLSAFQPTTAAVQDLPDMTTTQASAGSTPAPVTASVTTPPAVSSMSPIIIDPPASSPSSKGPPAQSPTTVSVDPPVQSPSSVDPPAQPETTENNDPPTQSPSTVDPPAQSGTTTSIDPPAPSPSTRDPPAQQVPSVNDPAPSSPNANTLTTQSSPVYIAPTGPAPAIIVGSSTIIAGPSSAFVIASQTLTPGGQIVHSSTTYALASNGGALIVGGSSTQLLFPASNPATPSPSYRVGTQTLVAGGAAITVSGVPYSIPSGVSSVVVGGSTWPIGTLILSSPEYVVGTQTLAAGGAAITISGSVLSLQSGGSSVVIGSETVALSSFLGGSTTTVNGMGEIIATIGGFGTQTSASLSSSTTSYLQVGTTGYNGTIFAGAAAASRGEMNVWVMGLIVLSGFLGLLVL